MARGKILLIDDEMDVRGFMKDFLEDRDFLVEAAADGLEGWEKFDKGNFDLVVCDMLMPKMIGLEVLRRIREKNPNQRVIMMTGVKEESMVEKAKSLGCYLYLNKPVQLKDINDRIIECFPS